jgi:cyclomaltodextrinase / maltogenic alpha-amylase / neopullulanase
MNDWAPDAFFYHIYPLGMLGAPERNDFESAPEPRLARITGWLDHLAELGVNAIQLGPVFESSGHGYDTADLWMVDRRLGTEETLRDLSAEIHKRGMRLVLDAVFNHVGRDFWAFRDVLTNGENSPYRDWFAGIRFDRTSPFGDPFAYEGWANHFNMAKLNLRNPAVRAHLLEAVGSWIDRFDIDGLRLDAADVVDLDFQRGLADFCRARRPDFWLCGEVVHGDYRRWATPGPLDSVTNYEAYKGLWSSLADRNYFEIAYALERQFGRTGMYAGLPLYNFVDNHDVDRVASKLPRPENLWPLHCLLFTMPGVPSTYYGSEWGIVGERTPASDAALRPALPTPDGASISAEVTALSRLGEHAADLSRSIAQLARVRREVEPLRRGGYRQLHVGAEQLAFARETESGSAVVVVNSAAEPAAFDIAVPGSAFWGWRDALNGETLTARNGRLSGIVPSNWARILVPVGS